LSDDSKGLKSVITISPNNRFIDFDEAINPSMPPLFLIYTLLKCNTIVAFIVSVFFTVFG
jgi:hypothetical protein